MGGELDAFVDRLPSRSCAGGKVQRYAASQVQIRDVKQQQQQAARQTETSIQVGLSWCPISLFLVLARWSPLELTPRQCPLDSAKWAALRLQRRVQYESGGLQCRCTGTTYLHTSYTEQCESRLALRSRCRKADGGYPVWARSGRLLVLVTEKGKWIRQAHSQSAVNGVGIALFGCSRAIVCYSVLVIRENGCY